jgi:hypothetical protein
VVCRPDIANIIQSLYLRGSIVLRIVYTRQVAISAELFGFSRFQILALFSMASPKKKAGNSWKNLVLRGVFYNVEAHQHSFILPEHVDTVREILLSSKGTWPEERWRDTIQEEIKQYVFEMTS